MKMKFYMIIPALLFVMLLAGCGLNEESLVVISSLPPVSSEKIESEEKGNSSTVISSGKAAAKTSSLNSTSDESKRLLKEKKQQLEALESTYQIVKANYDLEISTLKTELADKKELQKSLEQDCSQLMKTIQNITEQLGTAGGYPPVLDELDAKLKEKKQETEKLNLTISLLSDQIDEIESEWGQYIIEYKTQAELLKSEISSLSGR